VSDELQISVELAERSEKLARTWGYSGLPNAIAMAILDERKRCLAIARNWSGDLRKGDQARFTASNIASQIGRDL
jgi:ribosomal protein S28E/S33